jgi:hypothetical protein
MVSIGNPQYEYAREEKLPAIYFQNRDEAILQTIFEFGTAVNNTRWLIVTNGGPIRLRNLMPQTREYAGQEASCILFALKES